jgi:hypothetical protein
MIVASELPEQPQRKSSQFYTNLLNQALVRSISWRHEALACGK